MDKTSGRKEEDGSETVLTYDHKAVIFSARSGVFLFFRSGRC